MGEGSEERRESQIKKSDEKVWKHQVEGGK